jgi:hypothetical protein
MARLRQLIREAVTDDDLRKIVRSMVEAAKAGDLAAARELLNRVIGKPLNIADDDAAARGALLRSEFAAGCSSMVPDAARIEEMAAADARIRRALIEAIRGAPVDAAGH